MFIRVKYMHHFIFCKKDTLILNDEVLFDKNFSLDKFLEIGAVSKLDFNYEKSNLQSIFSNKLISENLINFTGNFTGSIHCASGSVSGIINCVSINQPGGICEPVNSVDDNGNIITDENGDTIILTGPEDFYYFQ